MGDRTEPLALDELLDNLEKMLGFDPAWNDRDGDLNGKGLSNLEEALDTAAPAKGEPLRPAVNVPVVLKGAFKNS